MPVQPAGLGALIETAAPFVAGWTVALIAIGLASNASTRSPSTGARDLVGSALRVWVVAFPVAALSRALILGRVSPWTFYVVAFVAAFALLAAWRVAFALGERRFRRTVA